MWRSVHTQRNLGRHLNSTRNYFVLEIRILGLLGSTRILPVKAEFRWQAKFRYVCTDLDNCCDVMTNYNLSVFAAERNCACNAKFGSCWHLAPTAFCCFHQIVNNCYFFGFQCLVKFYTFKGKNDLHERVTFFVHVFFSACVRDVN